MAESTPESVTSETPVAAPEATPAPESTAVEGEAPEGGEKPEPTERTFTQKELDEIVAKRAAQAERRGQKVARAEAEAAFYKQRLEELQRPAQTATGEPKAEDFKGKTYEEFMDARMDWRLNQERAKWQQESQAQNQQRQAFEQAQSVQSKLKPAFEKYPDFKEVALSDDVPISQPMAAYIASRATGGDVAYFLGQNIDEAARISSLHPIDQVLALRDLETKLTATPAPTRTPAPIVPNATKATVDRDPAKMSDKEFADWRRRQIAQRR